MKTFTCYSAAHFLGLNPSTITDWINGRTRLGVLEHDRHIAYFKKDGTPVYENVISEQDLLEYYWALNEINALTEGDIKKIKSLAGKESYSEIARQFDISRDLVRDIVEGKAVRQKRVLLLFP